MEKAYHQKCIELKRRLREIEEANDAAALRKLRLDRAVTKMRITRAFLMEQVAKSQANVDGMETDKGDSTPPTVYDPFPRVPTPVRPVLDGEFQLSRQPPQQQEPMVWSQSGVMLVPAPPTLHHSVRLPIHPTATMNPQLYASNDANFQPFQQPQGRPPRLKRLIRNPSPDGAPPSDGHRVSIPSEPPTSAREILPMPQSAPPYATPQMPVQIAPATQRPSLSHHTNLPPPHPHALAAAHAHPHPLGSPSVPTHVQQMTPTGAPVMVPINNGMPQQVTFARSLPLINSLPNGTSVMLIGPNEPKPAPWTIRDLGPQHQIHPDFEKWLPDQQERYIFDPEMPYLPYDVFGRAVRVEWQPHLQKYLHVHPDQPGYVNPVQGNIRTDTPDRKPRHYFNELRKAEEAAAERRTARHAREDKERRRQEHGGPASTPSAPPPDRESHAPRDRAERPISPPRRERVTDSARRESGRASDRNRESLREERAREMADEDEVQEVQGVPLGKAQHDGAAEGAGHRRRESERSGNGAAPAAGAGGFTAVNR